MSVYTNEQLGLYLQHIAFPREMHPEDPLELLTQLQRHHLARVPFESVSLHYSPHRLLSLDLEDLFEKIVTSSRGGYCMELNAFFGTVLRSLGFTLYSCGARVKTSERFGGWNHMLNLVTIARQKYAVDVGFGSNGAAGPIPLKEGQTGRQMSGSEFILAHKNVQNHTDPTQKLWVYQTRDPPSMKAEDQYAFTELEFFPEDYAVMNVAPMSSPRSFFVKTVIAAKAVMNAETGMLDGVYTIFHDTLRKRTAAGVEVLRKFEGEEDRIQALDDFFFVKLSRKERESIQGLPSEIQGRKITAGGLDVGQ